MDWPAHLKPLFTKYGGRKHPLDYGNTYQLLVMVILSAQTTDKLVNTIAPELFKKFPSIRHISRAKPEDLFNFIGKIRGFRKKADWIVRIARLIRDDKDIPLTIEELTALPGIGRKSANVIIREAGGHPQGIMIDLHVLRVVGRLGITEEKDPVKIENILMELIPQDRWHKAGMSFSYLGRELCRPTDPDCRHCSLKKYCKYNQNEHR